jgi:hypothetical protein
MLQIWKWHSFPLPLFLLGWSNTVSELKKVYFKQQQLTFIGNQVMDPDFYRENISITKRKLVWEDSMPKKSFRINE